MLFNKSNSR